MKITEFSALETCKLTETIITKLINSRKRMIRLHCSYPQYPTKINIYENFLKLLMHTLSYPESIPRTKES